MDGRLSGGRDHGVAVGVFAVAMSITAGYLVESQSFVRLVILVCLASLAVGFGLRAPRGALFGLAVWLMLLGLIRRLLSLGVASPGHADPLLLGESLMLGVLLLGAASKPDFHRRNRLGTIVALFGVAILLEVFNPLQGGLFAGMSALVFFVPIAAFWIGRTLDDETYRRLLWICAVAAVPAAAYGLLQTFHGYPSWDRRWIASSGYAALSLGQGTRPFSTFSSAAEYAQFLAVGLVIWIVFGRRLLRPVSLAVFGLLAFAIFYEGSRTSIFTAAGTLLLLAAAWRRVPIVVAVVAGAAVLLIVPYTVRQIAGTPTTAQSTTTNTNLGNSIVQHQVQGLSNPFDPNSSTAGAHLSLLTHGLTAPFRNPLGKGISTITIAGSKFGGGTSSSETDISNAAIAMGFPGLILFGLLAGTAIVSAYRLAVRRRDALSLAALAVLLALFGQWLNGGEYAVAWLPWLTLGWIDSAVAKQAPPSPEEPA
ncbi:MAG TPA: hypothetical protein VHD91_04085 [Gaiellaceae bacterium]|nr:hypothetical protein [Gaiellaceae bacterium]